jgi:hypothetical protein
MKIISFSGLIGIAIISLCLQVQSVDATKIYQVYNSIYNTNYDSNKELNSLLVSNDALWVKRDGVTKVIAKARYCAYTNQFGYYTTPKNKTTLWTFRGGAGTITSEGIINIGVGQKFGLFLKPLNISQTWYSDKRLNVDRYDHLHTYKTPNPNELFLAWEDLYNGGDKDHLDLVATIHHSNNPVPEPCTLMLISSGLAGLFWKKRRS